MILAWPSPFNTRLAILPDTVYAFWIFYYYIQSSISFKFYINVQIFFID